MNFNTLLQYKTLQKHNTEKKVLKKKTKKIWTDKNKERKKGESSREREKEIVIQNNLI